ncbi:MAG: NUDIX domain-containing protein [Nanoarchaeota archaeon]
MKDILDLIPEGSDIGVGLDIIKNNFHIFFLPGEKYILKENEMFYAGIGGHLEEGETLTKCAQREANEEVGVGVKLFSSSKTYYLPDKKEIQEITVTNSLQPLALYEMIYPQGVV